MHLENKKCCNYLFFYEEIIDPLSGCLQGILFRGGGGGGGWVRRKFYFYAIFSIVSDQILGGGAKVFERREGKLLQGAVHPAPLEESQLWVKVMRETDFNKTVP